MKTTQWIASGRMAAMLLLLFAPWHALSTTWFVATNGSDAFPGSSNSPFATIMRAQTAATSGDTVYLRGGTYFLNNTNITATNSSGPYNIVNNLNKGGISYLAFPGERPIFDFSAVQPVTNRVTAFLVSASDCVFKGFDVVGVQVTIAVSHTQSECFRVNGGNRNRFEQLSMHDGMGIGWYLTSGQSNLVLNCDAYNNRGLDSGSLGNIDGFGCHPTSTSGRGNVIRGCRAWFNSDDGYDLINAKAAVTIENCWSFYNGYFTNFANSTGDGNGFKSGGYGLDGSAPPNPVPRHVTRFCLAVRNRVNGFYANHHTGGLDWFNDTAYRNNVNFDMLCALTNNLTDVPGYDHVMKNTLGYKAVSRETNNLDVTQCDVSFNYFTLSVAVATNDFMSLDESLLTLPRQTNGALPYLAFAQPVSTSDVVNAGTNAGFAFAGTAPDLGAFEYALPPAPTLALQRIGTNLIFTSHGGPAGGTNYLVATTDLSIPASGWVRIATNKFDLAGNGAITNAISTLVPQQFYRVSLP
jgi:Pel9A-like, right handed beta helix region